MYAPTVPFLLSDLSTMTTSSKLYIVATNGDANVLIRRNEATYYDNLLSILHKRFPSIARESMIIQTNELDICAGRYIDIPDDLWLEISPRIYNIKVITRPTQTSTPAPLNRSMRIFVKTFTGKMITLTLPEAASVSDLVEMVQDNEGLPRDQQKLTYRGRELISGHNLSEYNVRKDSTVQVTIVDKLRGGKPVIYLFAPHPMNAVVRVALVKSWSFSALYPSIQVKSTESGQSIEWNVNTHEDHTMTDTATGTRVSYLFWEAETNPGCPPSPPSSPHLIPALLDTISPFNPLQAKVTNDESIVLPTSKIAPYIDKALTVLGLHVEARTSFITYWLPSILKHDYVALRFLPQASYEYAAPLHVEPKPDVVTRVFMLFKRVCEDELDEWEGALSRASEEVEFWKSVIGVDCNMMEDEALFRVLEWGGMEVKN
ncbi:uncharacterized protein EV420DRAFT_604824 [Desarmillaria tabescens]|uniref:Ubiquitin-like domain-containing protein n=1 Tax=Armillaria tabescens TaxID=1929756 RepID=A0AA39K6M7_ARMTA|nr:uncharacterized protein EV420DRAFT_604824 [Desarmillaria tabescens]KAK0454194.1 hypothetical protein EV420DRAFT_604824 [Desarmillaria tabescens]